MAFLYDLAVSSKRKVLKESPDYSEHYAPYITGQHWTSDPKGEANIVFAGSGLGSEAELPVSTIPDLFKKVVDLKGDKVALRSEEMPMLSADEEIPPPIPLKEWKSWTFAEYYNDCRTAAKGMISLGFEPHDAGNILGFNSREWFIGNMAAILAGGKSAGIYPTDNEEQIQFKVDHSNSSVLFVEDEEGFGKVRSVVNDMPYLKAVITWACKGETLKRGDGSSVEVMTFDELLALGANQDDAALDERIANQKPNQACSLIYTSGTTGPPKAVMISHDNLVYEASSVAKELKKSGVGTKAVEERLLSYLPLSHVAGMMVDIVCAIVVGVTEPAWVSVNFSRPYDLKRSSIAQRLETVQPTIFIGVPRVWEKIMEKLKAVGAQTKGLKRAVGKRAKARGLSAQKNMELGGSGKAVLGFPFTTILGVVKNKLGLAECKFAFAGAAPMTKECLEFFGSYDINVNEVYGMSECTGACSWSTDLAHTWGSVGYELSGTEIKILKSVDGELVECPRAQSIHSATEKEQGEICMRGRNNMMGYMANPRLGKEHVEMIEKKNAEAIDENGWLHSGDKGCIDVHGMLKITGRYKELIIGAGGENIAPVPIEDNLKVLLPAISNVMMVGDKQKYNIALVTLKAEGATGELPGSDQLTGPALSVSGAKTIGEAMEDPEFVAYLIKGFQDNNTNGTVVASRAAKIQKFTVLPADFSVQTGELTATLKLKRSVVASKYEDAIAKVYSAADDTVFVKCFN